MFTRVKGTQDISDLTLRNFLLEKVRKHLACYNFHEILTPLLEKTDLFKRAVGEHADIVIKEMYFVNSGKESEENERALCLRPEITASMMRVFLNSHATATLPWKVFTYGPVFRHERPQKGRYREFYQISVETIGATSPAQDAYFLTMLDRLFLEHFKLSDYALLINFLGCSQDRARYREHLQSFLEKNKESLCSLCTVRSSHNVLRILDCKNVDCQALFGQAHPITAFLCEACMKEWQLIQQLLHELSVSYTSAPYLVRGLDYYDKLVFEFVSIGGLGAQNAFCAGGRYDRLAEQLGATQDYPAFGAGLGIERIELLLENVKDRLDIPPLPLLHCILPLAVEQIPLALQIADELHAHCLRTETFLEGKSLKSMLRKADALKAATCIFIGIDEQEGRFVTVKQMQEGLTTKIPQTELACFLESLSQEKQ